MTPPSPANDPKPAVPPPPSAPEPGKETPPDDSQLSGKAWLVRNGSYLVILAAGLVFLYYYFGLAGMFNIFKAGLGLSFVIFIHELGHFAVAKWCDVHVETFSIGFGPALPGCSFKWGETVYKLALFPLGGYVKMLGEGDAEEGAEDNPRSYKKKTVGQRMMIISAGVIMNILLAIVCFTAVFLHGKEREAGVIGSLDSGGAAWKANIPTGAVIEQIGNRTASDYRPLYFTDLLSVVLSSYWDQQIEFKYKYFHPIGVAGATAETESTQLVAPSDEDNGRPMIGVSPPYMLELFPKDKAEGSYRLPVVHGSAANFPRQVDLRPGDVVTEATDPEKPDTLKPLDKEVTIGQGDQWPLARRWYELAGKPLTMKYRRGNENGTVETQPRSFEYGDQIVAATNPEKSWQLDPLPEDPRNPGSGRPDYFAFWRRSKLTAGQFMTVKVKHQSGHEEELTVPPAYTLTFGFKNVMGPITAIRVNSLAEQMGVHDKDLLKEVRLTSKGANGQAEQKSFIVAKDGVDPLRLPHEVQEWAYARRDVEVTLVVLRHDQDTGQDRAAVTLGPAKWNTEDRYHFSKERPAGLSSPLSIPALGLAYRVETRVSAVEENGPAAKAGVQPNDQIKGIQFKSPGTKEGEPRVNPVVALKENQWAFPFQVLQSSDVPEVMLDLERLDPETKKQVQVQVTLTARPDGTWPAVDRGFFFIVDTRTQRATDFFQAARMGLEDTVNTVTDVYFVLRGIATGRLAFRKTLGGPLTIGVVAYRSAGMGLFELIFFLGLISANLAVINFLPIPFLDGGHMMFLLYEKLRGKPAPESIQMPLTWLGLLALLLLMGSVIVMDVLRFWF